MFLVPSAANGKTVSFSDLTFQNVDNSDAATPIGSVASMGGNSSLSFTNCIFQNNAVVGSGGVLSFSVGSVTIDGCTFTNNSATIQGGAINLIGTATNLTITNSVFSGNSAGGGNGGAIFAAGNGTVAGVLTVTNSLFVGNSSTNVANTANGGAIHVSNNLRQALISNSTFYNNTTILQGGALYLAGNQATSKLTKITCFGNKINLADAVSNRGAGIRVEGVRPFVIENSLVYGNLQGTNDPLTAVASDLGVGGKTTLPTITDGVSITLTKSLFGATTLDDNDVATTSNIAANLVSSNLTYDATIKKVTYTPPSTAGDATPIDYVSSGIDAGAWNYVSLSVTDNQFAADFSVSYNSQIKNLKVLRSNEDSVSLEIYNLMGSKVLSLKNASKEENISASALQSGVYILVAKGSGNKSFAKKFVIN